MCTQSFDLSAISYHQSTPFDHQRSLLCHPSPPHLPDPKKLSYTDNISTSCDPKPDSTPQGSFLKALIKFSQNISYSSSTHDIYENQNKYDDYLIFQKIMKGVGKSVKKYVMDFKKKGEINREETKSRSKSKNGKLERKNKEVRSPLNLGIKKNLNQYFAGSTLLSPMSTTERKRLRSTTTTHSSTKNTKVKSPGVNLKKVDTITTKKVGKVKSPPHNKKF